MAIFEIQIRSRVIDVRSLLTLCILFIKGFRACAQLQSVYTIGSDFHQYVGLVSPDRYQGREEMNLVQNNLCENQLRNDRDVAIDSIEMYSKDIQNILIKNIATQWYTGIHYTYTM